MPAAVDQLIGAVGLVQREGLMDERLQLAGPYQRPDLRFQFADDLRLVVGVGVNGPDVLPRKGLYDPPAGASDIPGLEISGEVVALGLAPGGVVDMGGQLVPQQIRQGLLRLGARHASDPMVTSSAEAAFSEYVCSPSSTSSSRWLCTVARVVTMPVSPFRNLQEALVNARNTSPMYCGKSVAPGAVKRKTELPLPFSLL